MKTQSCSQGFKPTFKIQGVVYHLIGSLLPNIDETPKFAQIYFMQDKEEQIETRIGSNDHLRSELVEQIEVLVGKCNSYTKSFKYALKKMDDEDLKV